MSKCDECGEEVVGTKCSECFRCDKCRCAHGCGCNCAPCGETEIGKSLKRYYPAKEVPPCRECRGEEPATHSCQLCGVEFNVEDENDAQARCPECSEAREEDICQGCCSCHWCEGCEHWFSDDDECSNCSDCSDCCQCMYCDHCDNRVNRDDFCGECDMCTSCCECEFCSECSEAMDDDHQCGLCGWCTDCCNCSTCVECDVKFDSEQDGCDTCKVCESCLSEAHNCDMYSGRKAEVSKSAPEPTNNELVDAMLRGEYDKVREVLSRGNPNRAATELDNKLKDNGWV